MDAMEKLLGDRKKNASRHEVFRLVGEPVYHLDDIDPKEYMLDRSLSGCFCFFSERKIDRNRPGEVYVDGRKTGNLILSTCHNKGQNVAIAVRPYLHEYNSVYEVTIRDAYDEDGNRIPSFSFYLKTLPKRYPGEKYPEHDKVALQAAQEGIVLLRNYNHVLPLDKEACINPFGKGIHTFRLGCAGAGKIHPRYGIGLLEGIRSYSEMNLNEELVTFYKTEKDMIPDRDLLGRAKEKGNIALMVISRGTGESMDNPLEGGYCLSEDEIHLLTFIRHNFKEMIVVINSGYPLEMQWEKDIQPDAVIWCGLPGMEGGRALAQILDGRVNPSGKLPDTWAYEYNDYPASDNFPVVEEKIEFVHREQPEIVHTVYQEGIYVGYRYFDTFGINAAYSFGHGLSYTAFTKSATLKQRKNGWDVEVQVKNTGIVSGKEVVMIYVGLPDGRLEQPCKRLAAFAKTEKLEPEESGKVDLVINYMDLASYDEETDSWVIEPGEIHFYIGDSVSEAVQFGSGLMKEGIIVKKCRKLLEAPIHIETLSKYKENRKSYSIKEEVSVVKGRKGRFLLSDITDEKKVREAFVSKLSNRELCRLVIGGGTGWGADANGYAGRISNDTLLKKYILPDFYMADGNNGLNMNEPNIGFPTSVTMCATWNEHLLYEEGRVLAKEARNMELSCILAPALNLHRNPLCGRHAEYFSEDPMLAGRLAGMQSLGIESEGVSSCMKHFIANNAEWRRQYHHSIIPERAMRELYVRAFMYAMEVNEPDCMMTGYNLVNGCWCAADGELINDLLYTELRFSGVVMTDWGSTDQCTPVQALKAGNCLVMPGSSDESDVDCLAGDIEEGLLTREELEDCSRRILCLLERRSKAVET